MPAHDVVSSFVYLNNKTVSINKRLWQKTHAGYDNTAFFFLKRNGKLCSHFCHLHNLWCIPAIVSFAISDNIFVANWQWNLVFREDIFRYIQSKIYLQPMLNKYTLLFCLILYPYLAFINLILDIKIIPFSLLKIKSKKKK